MARVLHIDELEQINVAGVCWRPIRRPLDITGFGINAYSADAGALLIEEHDELGAGAGHHEELYVVVQGHARFTVDGEELDAPSGTLIFVPEAGSRRSARAITDGTTAIVVGGETGTIKASPWEYVFAGGGAAEAGDPQRAYELTAEGLTEYPDNAMLEYNLACFAALAGNADAALGHISRAFELDPGKRELAATDADLAALRSDPRYP